MEDGVGWFALEKVEQEAIVICNKQQGVLFANKAFQLLSGFSSEELIADSRCFLSERDHDKFFDLMHSNKTSVLVDCIHKESGVFASMVDIHEYSPEGCTGSSAECTKHVCIFRDPLFRTANVKSLLSSLYVLMGIFEYSEENNDCKHISATPAFAEALGKRMGDIVDRWGTELGFQQEEDDLKFYKECKDSKQPLPKTFVVQLADGKFIWLASSVCYIGDSLNGRPRYVYASEDVSFKRGWDLEEGILRAKEVAEIKSRFLANMSHELKSPLSAISGMAVALDETSLTREQRECVQTLHICSKSLLSQINDMLDFARLENHRIKLRVEEFDLLQCIEDALQVTAAEAEKKHIKLVYDIADDCQTSVRGDVVRLQQTLINLLNNAIKFASGGEVVLHASSKQIEQTGQLEILFSVTDSGVGISKADQQKLFCSFSQADASTTRMYGGIGLGLAICKVVVKMMGGSIWVESKEGVGSTFYFTIRAEPGSATRHHAPTPFSNKRALIVEYKGVQSQVLRHKLSRLGFSVQLVDSMEALQTVDEPPDIIFYSTDAAIVDKKGWSTVPMVVMGTKPKDFENILNKPIKEQYLVDAINSAFEKVFVTPQNLQQDTPAKRFALSHPMQILLVDDNLLMQKVALKLLGSLGYSTGTIDVANNGQEAIDHLEQRMVDAVLMDLQMPVLCGVEATQIIRQRWGGRRPFIIALTANTFEENVEECKAAGMNAFLTKPVHYAELQRVLHDAYNTVGRQGASLP